MHPQGKYQSTFDENHRQPPCRTGPFLIARWHQNLRYGLLKRNDCLKFGHYSSDSSVVLEASLPIQDSELTQLQLRRLIGSVLAEISSFKDRLPGVLENESSGAVLDQLMQRLIEVDPPNAT